MNGLDLLRRIREKGYPAIVILASTYQDFTYAKERIRLGAVEYLEKPYSEEKGADSLCREAQERHPQDGERMRRDVAGLLEKVYQKICEQAPWLKVIDKKDFIIGGRPAEEAEEIIKEINENGGVLGKQLVPVIEDGASDNAVFKEKAEKLLLNDRVATVFGCWTSASRKAVLPAFESSNGLLWYPVQYEGQESSPNIFYIGAAPNQQIVPAIEYMNENYGKKVFLLGSDYVFPRTANAIVKKQAEALGMEIVGEEYTPMGHTDYTTILSKIKEADPDFIFNTLNGDSNVAFFKQFKDAGLTPEQIQTCSVSIAEEEVKGIGASYLEGHLVAWNYYQTTAAPENEKFVEAYKAEYGADRVTDDLIEAGYNAVYLWAAAVEKAGTTDVDAVKEAAEYNGLFVRSGRQKGADALWKFF